VTDSEGVGEIPEAGNGESVKTLAEITDAMKECAIPGDPEISHRAADELLCEALDRLATDQDDTVAEKEAREILRIYHTVPKWYA